MDWIIAAAVAQGTLIWFAIKMYVKNENLKMEIDHLKEKIGELKEFIKGAK